MLLQKNVSALVFFAICSCETQTVEYRSRPTWHTALSREIPMEKVRKDGTIMKYSASNAELSRPMQEYLDSIVLEEKDERTGKLTLRSIFPEHVIKHTMTCLRDRNWELLFEQIIGTEIRQNYSNREDGRKEFESFFSQNRKELARTLQRIHQGLGFGDVQVYENGNLTTHTLSPRVASEYTFTSVVFIREDQFLKLHSIR